jgi:hypothetical protein
LEAKKLTHNDVGDVRRSAALMTFGPGSIIDMRAGDAPVSGVHCGLEDWDLEAPLSGILANQKIIERRLCYKLGKRFFRLPPVVERKPQGSRNVGMKDFSLLVRRFPNWLQCPNCSKLQEATKWPQEPGFAYRYCAVCTENRPGKQKVFAVPVRFVTACESGHLDDFPWNWWVRHKKDCSASELVLKSIAAGLSGLKLTCLNCRASRSLEHAFNKIALAGLQCKGSRPWLSEDDQNCDNSGENGKYRVVQRGASNLYYPVFESALDIPPWTAPIQSILNDRWDDLEDIEDPDQRLQYIKNTKGIMDAAKRSGLSAEDIFQAFGDMQGLAKLINRDELRLDEYRILNSKVPNTHKEFESAPVEISLDLKQFLSSVTRVARMREVRVLKGFTRIKPPSDDDSQILAPLSLSSLDWLPAIEIRGEGIFIGLQLDRLNAWEKQKEVIARTRHLDEAHLEIWKKQNPDRERDVTCSPRRILLHTFAHGLISQLTLECGYSTASLRERLYIDDSESGMCGVLIYTGTSDSDGTLGGLQARAEKLTLESTINGALNSMRWCSSDPLCIQGELAIPDAFSIASCHSCALLPETSCECHNRFLDRGLLVGTPENMELGFFSTLLGGR